MKHFFFFQKLISQQIANIYIYHNTNFIYFLELEFYVDAVIVVIVAVAEAVST